MMIVMTIYYVRLLIIVIIAGCINNYDASMNAPAFDFESINIYIQSN